MQLLFPRICANRTKHQKTKPLNIRLTIHYNMDDQQSSVKNVVISVDRDAIRAQGLTVARVVSDLRADARKFAPGAKIEVVYGANNEPKGPVLAEYNVVSRQKGEYAVVPVNGKGMMESPGLEPKIQPPRVKVAKPPPIPLAARKPTNRVV